MRRILPGIALLGAGLFVLPLFAREPAQDKKDTTEPPKKEEKKDSPYKVAGQIVGKLVHYDEAKKRIKVKVEEKVVNQGEYQAMLQAQQRMQQHQLEAARARNINERNSAINNYNNAQRDFLTHQAKLYKMEAKDVDFDTLDMVAIRVTTPQKFNEKGEIVDIKKLTKAELDELKGPDKSLPGYTGETSDLKDGTPVQLTLVVPK